MKKNLSLTAIFLFFIAFCQPKIKVIDAENNQPISYAKITFKGKDYYKNAEENGEFMLLDNEEIEKIESFGYESILVQTFQNVYSLKPKYKEIEELILEKPHQNKFLIVGNIKKEIYSQSFVSSKNTWAIANFVEYNETYNEYKFIKSIKFHSKVEKTNKKATINLLLYKNKNGKPSDEIWKSFIVECKPKKNITIKNFNTPILFPKEGIFIGFEWIINDENTFEKKATYNSEDGKKENTLHKYNNPFIYSQKSETNQIFYKIKNDWKQFDLNPKNDNRNLSIEIVLSN